MTARFPTERITLDVQYDPRRIAPALLRDMIAQRAYTLDGVVDVQAVSNDTVESPKIPRELRPNKQAPNVRY